MDPKAREKFLRQIEKRRNSAHRKKRFARILSGSMSSLEDSKNLKALSSVAASATNSAHEKAVSRVDEIVYVEDNKVIRKEKGKHPQIIEELSPRKVNKGDILYLKNS